MKKSSIIFVLVLSLFLLCGCSKKENKTIVSDGKKVNISNLSHKTCTREASTSSGIDATLSYDLYYKEDDLYLLHSVEKVTATNNSDLDEYENAYKSIEKHYEGLEYYDTKITRGDTTVTNDVTINYEKIDIDKLLDIEGEEDNIIENGKAKVSKWIELAKKLGTKCEDAS